MNPESAFEYPTISGRWRRRPSSARADSAFLALRPTSCGTYVVDAGPGGGVVATGELGGMITPPVTCAKSVSGTRRRRTGMATTIVMALMDEIGVPTFGCWSIT